MIGRIIVIQLLCFLSFSLNAYPQKDYDNLRNEMVITQLVERGVKNPDVLNAMTKVKRHLFVPEEVENLAYGDHALSIGEGQTISQPYIVATMTEYLDLDKESRVLEIGTGSGYQAAILGEIVKEVYTIEIVESLAQRSGQLLRRLGYNNIHTRIGDGYVGWEEFAPYDAIIVTCAPSQVPAPLVDQLSEGGRLIIPVGEKFVQKLILLRKENGKLKQESIADVLFVPMLDSMGIRYD